MGRTEYNNMKEWDPEAVKQALDLELIPEEGQDAPKSDDVANKKLYDSTPYAADALIHICLYSESETMRYRAATYILDKVIGKPNDAPMHSKDSRTALERLAEVATNPSSGN